MKGIPAMTSEKEASYASIREKKSDSREITGREKGCRRDVRHDTVFFSGEDNCFAHSRRNGIFRINTVADSGTCLISCLYSAL